MAANSLQKQPEQVGGRRAKAARDPRPRNEPMRALTWNYSVEGPKNEPVVAEVLKEINGRDLRERDPRPVTRVDRAYALEAR